MIGDALPYIILGLLAVAHFSIAEDSEPGSIFSRASCDFAIRILKAESKLKSSNVILSPSSVGTLLSILQQGAKGNTLKELGDVLQITPEQSTHGYSSLIKSLQGEKSNVTLEWGNRAYVRPGFELNDDFNKTIQENFQAIISELNFVEPSSDEAATTINAWVNEVTHGNIQNLIPPAALTADTVFILLNAIYFKGLWDVPFKKILTKSAKFEQVPENFEEVPFMSQKERFVAGEDTESGIKWVDLPFKDEQFSMLFILPTERHGLAQVLEKMSGTLLNKIIHDDQTRQVTLSIPKFKLKEKTMLSASLQELGLKEIFTSEADFQGMARNFKNLKVSRIIQEASVEIDEDGSTASAATGILIEVTSFPKASDSLIFHADHPFLFFILDKTNKLPLFVGKVVDPR